MTKKGRETGWDGEKGHLKFNIKLGVKCMCQLSDLFLLYLQFTSHLSNNICTCLSLLIVSGLLT